MNPTIAAQFATLEKACIPPNASDIQRQESKRFFYAGAGAVLNMLLHTVASPDVPEVAGVLILQTLHEEVALFVQQIQAGRA